MLDYCCTPQPFVIGVLRSSLEELHMKMAKGETERELVLVDIDNDHCSLPPTSPDKQALECVKLGAVCVLMEEQQKALLAKPKNKHRLSGSLFTAAASPSTPTISKNNDSNAALATGVQGCIGGKSADGALLLGFSRKLEKVVQYSRPAASALPT